MISTHKTPSPVDLLSVLVLVLAIAGFVIALAG